jgi:hypothetical protein
MKSQTGISLMSLAAATAAAFAAPAQYTFTNLDAPLGVIGTFAQAICGTNIVGYYIDRSVTAHGFLYNGSTWTTLDYPPGVYQTSAQGISGTHIVGYYSQTTNTTHGFLYDGSTWTTLDAPLGVLGTFPSGIWETNIVGYYLDRSDAAHGFLYDGSTWTTLDHPQAFGTYAQGISGTNIVGSYFDTHGYTRGFFYNGSTWTTLDMPSADITLPQGISGTNIVGTFQGCYPYCMSVPFPSQGFIYDGSSWTLLNDPLDPPSCCGFSGTAATGISGPNVVGYYSSTNMYRSFLATPIPQLAITLSGTHVELSWPALSQEYVLQQNLVFSSPNWFDITNQPTLNVTDLRNELALPSVSGSAFYRLKQQ